MAKYAPIIVFFKKRQNDRNHSITNATFCLAHPSKNGVENYIWQFKHILEPSFDHQYTFKYSQIKFLTPYLFALAEQDEMWQEIWKLLPIFAQN